MIEVFREIFRYRELLWSLTLKQLKIRYKQTFLGIAWALFTPLAMMLIFTFIFSRIAKISTADIPYLIFVYCGLLPWTFFSGSLSTATTVLVSNTNLITKVYFPREVFPLSIILSKFVDFCIASLILIGLMFFYRVNLHFTILFVPLVLLTQIMLMTGLSFLLSMGNLFYRDVKYIFDVVIVLWMFATSVIYPINVESAVLQRILMLNPMTPIIDAYRALILKGTLPNLSYLGVAAAISIAIFFVGLFYFHRNEHLFAENI